MRQTIVINDGQYRWGASRQQLLEALNQGGWYHAGSGIWREPEQEPDADPVDAPYTMLCASLDSVAGEGSSTPMTDDFMATSSRFTYRPDLDGWLLED